MRIFFLITFSICFFSLTEAQKSSLTISDNKSIEKIINSNWAFNYFPDVTAESGYESTGFDDYGWPAVSIPHTWNTYETTGDIHPYIKFTSETENPYWWNGWGWSAKGSLSILNMQEEKYSSYLKECRNTVKYGSMAGILVTTKVVTAVSTLILQIILTRERKMCWLLLSVTIRMTNSKYLLCRLENSTSTAEYTGM
jgi:ABC-type maltose transport system permease subunit